jgi:CheY-like chemotaxis protein/anti-sigma regulatory factor (Ser/Thr protein kinase)
MSQGVLVTTDVHVFAARTAVRARAQAVGFGRIGCDELVIVASELASNILKYGVRGEIIVTQVNDPVDGHGVRIEARDEGPAFHDLAMALRDGCGDRGPLDPATIFRRKGLGAGLGAVVRFTDTFECREEKGGKRIVVVRFVLRPKRPRTLAEGGPQRFRGGDLGRERKQTMRQILVVDDSETMRSFMRLLLVRMKDYQVRFLKNGQEALESISEHGEPSLILLDINMPVMNGLEFLGRMTELGLVARVPVVLVSTEGRDEDILRGLESGAKAYLRKPFKPQELHQVIERVLG